MKKTTVLNVVGLTPRLIGEHTPFLRQWSSAGATATIIPPLPAVTCTAQATYLTGCHPSEHGIVGNGWYFKDECEIKFWRQSNKLVRAKKIWEYAKEKNPDFTCANLFWWYNMYSSVDYAVTPRPQYLADGRKFPDCYTTPPTLRDLLQSKLGTFPLFDFWGPKTSIRSSQWIAEAAKIVEKLYAPTLTLIYLPHLDYNLQRFGNAFPGIEKDLQEIDSVCRDLIQFYEQRHTQVIVLSEYGITPVQQPSALNRIFRKHNLITVREERGLELLDAGASKAFAVADHQVAHIYINDSSALSQIRSLLENTPGIELILDETGKKQYHLHHERAGDLVAVADAQSWFSYYYWLDDRKAPDFARTVDIHRKPGYDPVELFTDPGLNLLPLRIAFKLLSKKLGFRTLMDIIPLRAELVGGSHGRVNNLPEDQPVFISRDRNLVKNTLQAADVFNLLSAHLAI
ncbi:MAG: alkaline phosphatase family protein [Chitinophagales bacterium]|nr:MAG: alkaline phosphatase family protein [Chitinophagales bacterium]